MKNENIEIIIDAMVFKMKDLETQIWVLKHDISTAQTENENLTRNISDLLNVKILLEKKINELEKNGVK